MRSGITAKKKIDSLTEDLERRENRQRTLEKQIQEMSLEITDRYETYIGKGIYAARQAGGTGAADQIGSGG